MCLQVAENINDHQYSDKLKGIVQHREEKRVLTITNSVYIFFSFCDRAKILLFSNTN